MKVTDQKKKKDVRFEYALCRIFAFVSFPLFGFNLVIKPRNIDFECC